MEIRMFNWPSCAMQKPEPRPRPDGRCALKTCGKMRKLPANPGRHLKLAHYELDPFCSSTCCRIYHGTVVEVPPQQRRRRMDKGRVYA